MRTRNRLVRAVGSVAGFGLLLWGCESPTGSLEGQALLQEYVETSIQRELAAMPPVADPLTTESRGPTAVEEALAKRRDELDLVGPRDTEFDDANLDIDLNGAPQGEITMDLRSAVLSAVRRNLGVTGSSLQPAITAEEVIRAEAVFDFLLFGSVEYASIDQPRSVAVVNGIPLGTPFDKNDTFRFETGVTKRFTTGATATISTDLTTYNNRTPGISFSPDPAYNSAVRLGLQQPLLRGFGREVNTAEIRLAENVQERSVEQLQADLLQVVEETENAYWNLVFSWRELIIRQWLVDVGIEVRDILERRMDFDTNPAEYADAVATVEDRATQVIRARRRLQLASDALKALMNDPDIAVASEALIRPTDAPDPSPITYSLRDLILTAMGHRPEIRQAALFIDDSRIRQLVADNARLPVLNLSAEMAYFGLDDGVGDSYDELTDSRFVDYIIGAVFEYPLGNRSAEAAYRRARLERSAAVIDYRRVVQLVVLDVKNALRDVVTNYELIRATRSFRVAQAENLRALRVEEETLAGLTPEFLNLKFQRQDGLALARAQEVQALVEFRQSVASLYRAAGTGLEMKGIAMKILDDPDAALMEHAADN